MKKTILLFFIFSSLIVINAQKKDYSHWSLTLEGGANMFDGDINQEIISVIPTSFLKVSFGGSLQYTFNPIWGLGVEYYRLPYSAEPASKAYSLDGQMNHINSFIAINLFNLFDARRADANKWNVWATLGGGFAWYDNIFYDNTKTEVPGNYGRRNALIVPVGVLIEYNMSKSLALGAKLSYRSHNKDNLEGVTSYGGKIFDFGGVTNDYMSLGTLALRWKFNAVKKDHVRNINMLTYYPTVDNTKLDNLASDVGKLKTKVDDIDDKVNKLVPRIERLEKMIDNVGADADEDGVIDVRDKEPNTPKNTIVDFWGKTLAPEKLPTTLNDFEIDNIPAVYFDFDQIKLDDEALTTIRKVAAKMKANEDLIVEIRGYADNIGDVPYNNKLSQRRADRVKQELVKVWGLSDNKIIANGKGKIGIPTIRYRPNRRCDFFYSN